ncbi:hypothetical protein N7535_002327 [Penicillium sp. DV-2018c]|nr:hypothetical protein N7461_004435 [Penicillium sp. DV-2018c]KAJ5583707.1 hypothetical protein N7535_002327 [Penicillium sp. DV-2018c]
MGKKAGVEDQQDPTIKSTSNQVRVPEEQRSTPQWRGTRSAIVTSIPRTHRAANADNNNENVDFRPEDNEAWRHGSNVFEYDVPAMRNAHTNAEIWQAWALGPSDSGNSVIRGALEGGSDPEARILAAVFAYHDSKKYLVLTKLAREYDVPYDTPIGRIRGRTSRSQRIDPNKALLLDQDQALMHWIDTLLLPI